METTYISIDVAVRSLAIGVYRIKHIQSINDFKDNDPIVMNSNLNSIFIPISMGVYDINNHSKTKDTSIIDKAVSLKKTLQSLDDSIKQEIANNEVIVLIEYQMNANHTANSIFNMICMYYAGTYPIKVMPPALKNTICLHPMLSHSAFLGLSSTNYKANKNHCKYSMLYLLTMIDRMDMIADIKKTNLDDIADSLMQCLAFHIKKQ